MNFAYQLTSLFTNIVWRSKSDRISRETLSESASKAGKNREAAASQKPNCRIVHGTTCVQSKVLGCNAVNARTCSLWFQVRIFFVLFNSATDFGNSKNLSIKTNRFKFRYLFSKTIILFGDPTSKLEAFGPTVWLDRKMSELSASRHSMYFIGGIPDRMIGNEFWRHW